MADDTYTYQINQSIISHKNNAFTRLISEERTKKLELLKHLLNHSSEPLVICGPEGIGKSTLLKVLQEQARAKSQKRERTPLECRSQTSLLV